jgi:hypothetical protein
MIEKFNVKDKIIFIALLFFVLPTFMSLLRPGYFPMHDDMQAMRLLQMDKCFADGQIPCRWVPDMGYGYGYPQFNYYAPLPYYFMEGFHLLGFGYLDSVKSVFVLSVVLSAWGMYLLGRSLWGRAGGMISALFYSYSYYRAVDMYVRGAVGEIFGLAFIPFVFWSSRKVIKGDRKSVLVMAISLAGILTSHNITALMLTPFLFLWLLYLLLFDRKSHTIPLRDRISNLFLGSLWGFSLSAYFLIPVWLEKRYVHVETLLQGYFNYLAHFVSIKQLLFSSYFNYGTSEIGSYDEMSLSVGLMLWLFPLIILGLFILLNKKESYLRLGFFVLLGWIALFLTHSRSTFIWKNIKIMEYMQFPWRFLIIATFSFSVGIGALSLVFRSKKSKIFLVFSVFMLLVFFNSQYFKPKDWINITDKEKFSGENWEKQLTISIFDYLPIYAEAPPANKAPEKPVFIEGKGEVLSGSSGSNWQEWSVEVLTNAKVELPLYYFPGWQVTVDGKSEEIDFKNSLGLINLNLEEGLHNISVKLEDTPVRKYSNYLTLVAFLFIPFYKIREKRK